MCEDLVEDSSRKDGSMSWTYTRLVISSLAVSMVHSSFCEDDDTHNWLDCEHRRLQTKVNNLKARRSRRSSPTETSATKIKRLPTHLGHNTYLDVLVLSGVE